MALSTISESWEGRKGFLRKPKAPASRASRATSGVEKDVIKMTGGAA